MENFCLKNDIKEICEKLSSIRESFEDKTLVLTGAGGFLGRYFLSVFKMLNEKYLSKPCKVIAYDNFATSKDVKVTIDNEFISFHVQDICVDIELNDSVNYIIHAAGIASPFYYRAHPLKTIDAAIIGTRKMLELAKKNGAKFLFFSSSEIYGNPDPKYIPTPESYNGYVSCLGPRACYDESKRLGETLCRIYSTQQGVHTNIVRPFNIYGPGMAEKDYRILPNVASRIKSGKPLQIYGSGNQTRTFCYVTDAIYGFLHTLIHGVSGEPYNIGNPHPEISMLALAEKIKGMVNKDIAINIIDHPDTYPADEPNRRCPDITKATNQLNYKPTIPLEVGLERFLTWANNNYTAL